MEKPPAVIKPLTDRDLDAWMPLWKGYQAFYKVEIPADVTAITWKRLLDPSEAMGGALAWDKDRAVGLVHHVQHRSCWTIGDYLYLQDLFVAPDSRGGGIGRRLIEYVYVLARQRGISRVYWLTHETNSQAMLLYDRIAIRSGFVQYRHALS